ncbi:MAG: patatin-like phospholipase family protein [Pseudomonadota bacterium]
MNIKQNINQLQRDFSLVLSGGGALGIAHLNVLRALDESNLKPKEIIGTSMGAILGSCYALNYSDQEIYQFIKNFSNIFKWGKISFSNGSLLSTDKIADLFSLLFADKKIAETAIELKIVATDFNTGKAEVFDKNSDISIKHAVLASMAIPGIFPPVKINNNFYVDGFISSNLPVEFAQYDSILACNVLGKNSFNSYQEKDYQFFGHTKAVLGMLERSLRLFMYNKAQEPLHNKSGVVLIEPKVAQFKTFDFNKYERIIKESCVD